MVWAVFFRARVRNAKSVTQGKGKVGGNTGATVRCKALSKESVHSACMALKAPWSVCLPPAGVRGHLQQSYRCCCCCSLHLSIDGRLLATAASTGTTAGGEQVGPGGAGKHDGQKREVHEGRDERDLTATACQHQGQDRAEEEAELVGDEEHGNWAAGWGGAAGKPAVSKR